MFSSHAFIPLSQTQYYTHVHINNTPSVSIYMSTFKKFFCFKLLVHFNFQCKIIFPKSILLHIFCSFNAINLWTCEQSLFLNCVIFLKWISNLKRKELHNASNTCTHLLMCVHIGTFKFNTHGSSVSALYSQVDHSRIESEKNFKLPDWGEEREKWTSLLLGPKMVCGFILHMTMVLTSSLYTHPLHISGGTRISF